MSTPFKLKRNKNRRLSQGVFAFYGFRIMIIDNNGL